ncbi:MAG TPA: VPLPA-CTERM sorting domain-containing protein [Methylophilus sp.]|nr:VPLPA-CTERM sorting domain-containing protein [Methylophilus sp.]HQQ32592.1 VPLPA-CTERM sorting domain-containing protein [Methylophilus sp.]
MSRLTVGLLALGLSFAVNAEQVKLKFDGVNTTTSTKVRINGSTHNVAMGSYNLVEGLSPNSQSLVGFCVDPYEYANSKFTTYEKSSLDATDFRDKNGVVRADGATRLANVQKLFDNAYATLGSDNNKTAGFHLALWEIFNDNLNLASGDVQKSYYTNASVLGYAQGFLNDLAGWSATNLYSLTMYASIGHWDGFGWCKDWVPGYQDFLVAKLNPPNEVPLPAALPMLLSGLVGLGLMGSRRKV